MQKDYTVFKIPNQPQVNRQAGNFAAAENEVFDMMGQLGYGTPKNDFPLYDELNNIAEELEKCRLRNSLI